MAVFAKKFDIHLTVPKGALDHAIIDHVRQTLAKAGVAHVISASVSRSSETAVIVFADVLAASNTDATNNTAIGTALNNSLLGGRTVTVGSETSNTMTPEPTPVDTTVPDSH